jgi:hypothetical protein
MPEPATATLAAFGKALDVAEKLGLFQKLWATLLGDPSTAARQLEVALVEVRRTFGSLRDTLLEISYLGVPGQEIIDVRRALDRLKSGELYQDVIRAKGSCHKIGNIYDNHLVALFRDHVIDPVEQAKLHGLFEDLRDSDGWAVDAMECLLVDANPMVPIISKLVESGEGLEAQEEVERFLQAFQPTLDKLSETMTIMLSLETEFIRRKRLT